MHVEIPAAVFGFTPLCAVLWLMAAYVRRYGLPDFHTVMAGIMAFFAIMLMSMSVVGFGLKFFSPEYGTYSQLSDNHMMAGAATSMGLVLTALGTKFFSQKTDQKEPQEK